MKAGRASVSAWEDYKKNIDLYFNTVKAIFSTIYREHSPLQTSLIVENPVRSLSAQHLLHLGDICKFYQKFE